MARGAYRCAANSLTHEVGRNEYDQVFLTATTSGMPKDARATVVNFPLWPVHNAGTAQGFVKMARCKITAIQSNIDSLVIT